MSFRNIEEIIEEEYFLQPSQTETNKYFSYIDDSNFSSKNDLDKENDDNQSCFSFDLPVFNSNTDQEINNIQSSSSLADFPSFKQNYNKNIQSSSSLADLPTFNSLTSLDFPFHDKNCNRNHYNENPKEKVKYHLKDSHQNQKQFQCELCKQVFKRKYHLLRHQIKHSNKPKPFQCQICLKYFSRKDNLARHLNVVHKDIENIFERRFIENVEQQISEIQSTPIDQEQIITQSAQLFEEQNESRQIIFDEERENCQQENQPLQFEEFQSISEIQSTEHMTQHDELITQEKKYDFYLIGEEDIAYL